MTMKYVNVLLYQKMSEYLTAHTCVVKGTHEIDMTEIKFTQIYVFFGPPHQFKNAKLQMLMHISGESHRNEYIT